MRGKRVNKQEKDILLQLNKEPFISQRVLSEISGYSLGTVNQSIRNLMAQGYLDEEVQLTEIARDEFELRAPRNAIILAAGVGMRMVPINMQIPKGLIEIKGEPLIERIIKQLNEVGIREIYVVVGFMKEQFEYLIDGYNVELIVNEDYALKNNLHSLFLASSHISNTYIVPCDIWSDKNPFSQDELYSWYMVTDCIDDESTIRVNRKKELVVTSGKQDGNSMVGIAYLTEDVAEKVKSHLERLDREKRYDNSFWEETLYDRNKMILPAKVVHSSDFIEINTYEQLRDLDEDSDHLKSDVISLISEVLGVNETKITEITILKKGMTNRSFCFACGDKKYIMRIPGEGTDQLINRANEAAVYKAIDGKGICDEIVYINSDNGYKITEFIKDSRVCDPGDIRDVKVCMDKLRSFHRMGLKVEHKFDIFEQIEFYESLWNGTLSVYKDYLQTKERVFLLKKYIDRQEKEYCLTHIDAVPDNFLFTTSGEIKLIDWEYAGMQDPHVDIAMFCIYALYNQRQVDKLIDIYFDEKCEDSVRIKIYCYISACGLLWSNWCEYKRSLGIEFGEYSLRQYRYAKEFYKLVLDKLRESGEELK